jgi:hypothetical protein
MKHSFTRWVGPSLAATGVTLFVFLAFQSPGSRTLVSWWVLERALSAEKALPLIGLGAAIALISCVEVGLCVGLYLAGAWLGFRFHELFVEQLSFLPNAADHLFLTGPISLVSTGLLLISTTMLRHWLAPVVSAIIGAMLAEVITLTDPTMDSSVVSFVGIGLGLWAIVTTLTCVRTFHRDWFPIGLRIVGSWFLAIGLLYGSAAFVRRPELPSAPVENLMPPPTRNNLPDLNANPPGSQIEELPAQP